MLPFTSILTIFNLLLSSALALPNPLTRRNLPYGLLSGGTTTASTTSGGVGGSGSGYGVGDNLSGIFSGVKDKLKGKLGTSGGTEGSAVVAGTGGNGVSCG